MSGKYETYFSQMFGTHIYFLLQMLRVKIVYWLTCQWCGRGRYLARQGSSDCAQLTCDLTIANFHLCHKLLMNITLLFHIFAFSPKYIDKPAQIIVILYLFWDAPSEGVCRVHICRDQWDRRSRKIFVDCVNFSVNNANCEQNLPNPHILRKHLCHFYAKCANIGQIYTYCVNICATFTQSV